METAQRLFDNLDFSRGVKSFLDCIPAASIGAMLRGNEAVARTRDNRYLHPAPGKGKR